MEGLCTYAYRHTHTHTHTHTQTHARMLRCALAVVSSGNAVLLAPCYREVMSEGNSETGIVGHVVLRQCEADPVAEAL